MPSYQFDRPIPGQSLVDEPRNAPYERPPEIVDPEEALIVHLHRLNDPDAMEDAMFFLEAGVDIQTLVEGILRSAVMNGIHTIDVSLIIAPVIHEMIKQTADALGVDYKEGFEKEDKGKLRYNRRTVLAAKKLKEMGGKPKELAEQIDMVPNEAPAPADDQMEMDLSEPMTKGSGMGLMSKGK